MSAKRNPEGEQVRSRGGDPMLGMLGIPITRRSLLRSGLIAATGFWLTDRLGAPACAEPPAAKAKAIIHIWLWGGPSHIDTFDPKPDAGNDYCGPLRSTAATNVPGVAIGELLPLLAKQVRQICPDPQHDARSERPRDGRLHGADRQPDGRQAGVSAHRCRGVEVDGLRGRLRRAHSALCRAHGAARPVFGGGLPRAALQTVCHRRRSQCSSASWWKAWSRRGSRTNGSAVGANCSRVSIRWPRLPKDRSKWKPSQKAENEAYDLILGDAGKVFDLSQETDELRTKYGRTTFGQSCLMARRLIEKGVRFITINYGGWDTHKENFQAMRRMVPQLDKGVSSLLEDLAAHGLLDSTIVWCSGEFGRTPQVQWEAPWNGGRNHFGAGLLDA